MNDTYKESDSLENDELDSVIDKSEQILKTVKERLDKITNRQEKEDRE